jgi:GMC oxidoreductase
LSSSTGQSEAAVRYFATAPLFICDGSILPTQGSANPGLTIEALGRTAGYLIKRGDAIFYSSRGVPGSVLGWLEILLDFHHKTDD